MAATAISSQYFRIWRLYYVRNRDGRQHTIASYIQQAAAQSAGDAIRVYNFGRPGYTSTQEMLLYLWLLRSGFVPTIAVFIDGLNECQMGRDSWSAAQPLS
jgi:hypothetical protein